MRVRKSIHDEHLHLLVHALCMLKFRRFHISIIRMRNATLLQVSQCKNQLCRIHVIMTLRSQISVPRKRCPLVYIEHRFHILAHDLVCILRVIVVENAHNLVSLLLS